MADSTMPILATGAITLLNEWIGNNKGFDLKIVVGTGIAAISLSLFEHVSRPLAVGIAWIALVTSLLVPPKSGQSAVNNLISLTGLGGKKA